MLPFCEQSRSTSCVNTGLPHSRVPSDHWRTMFAAYFPLLNESALPHPWVAVRAGSPAQPVSPPLPAIAAFVLL
ncbi:MAG: hypothetical protein F6K28_44945, partial [Microcoleus sp. SIO2G3]|nr:hypothetical protein [Microcoleus sp. SIO2G3]